MNLILISKDDFTGPEGRVRLTGRRHEHILKILKPSEGDSLCVGMIGGLIGTGRVTLLNKEAVEMEVVLSKDPPPPLDLTLILALPRPIVLKRLLAQVTALGVKKIILIQSERVEKSYWKSPSLSNGKITEQLMLGLEQAKDTITPEVLCCKKFKPFVEDELPQVIKGTRAFVADPEAQEELPCRTKGPATLVIGPEGGFIPYEIEKLSAAGCAAVSLGKRILRVETAVISSIARLKF